jgi:hypothetical protein
VVTGGVCGRFGEGCATFTQPPMRLPRRIVRRLIAGALLVPALSACDSVTGPDDLDGEERRLQRAWQRWDAQATWDYDYVLRRDCFCGQEVVGPVRIVVRNGVVVDRYYVTSGASVPLAFERFFPTIDGLFAEVADAIDFGAARLETDYDDAWGFPRLADIDYRASVADDEVVLNAYGFIPR